MPNPYFAFKQFVIHHDRCAMKVGTDGVLLGAWTDVSLAHRVLEIGTGTGLVALMLAQRCGATILAIDIDKDAVGQAQENVSASPWGNRVEVGEQDVRSYETNMLFDTIVSNPPYFIDSLKCPDGQRSTARHTDTLHADELMEKVPELLTPEGKFSLIIPFEQSEELVRYLLREFEEDTGKIWESNIFGKSLHDLVNEGLHNKLYRMPPDARAKLAETIERIINDGCSGLICIIL